MKRCLSLVVLAGLISCVSPSNEKTPLAASPRYALSAQDNWQKLTTVPYKGKQDDIHFVDAQTGWYGNGEGKIYKTSDGGTTWSEQLSKQGTFVRALGFVDAQRGFMGNVGTDYYPGVTDTNPLYETRDGGQSWNVIAASRISGPIVKGICAIDVLKKQSIYQGTLQDRVIVHAAGRVGGPAFLMRSLDGGETWKSIDLTQQAGAILDVKFFDENIGLIFAASDADSEKSNGLILMTRDGGQTFKQVYRSARPFELTWKGHFPSRNVGYATLQSYNPDKAISKRYVVKTIDGGLSWQELELTDDHAVREFGVGFVDDNIGWVGSSTTGFQTTDGGKQWTRVDMGKYVNKIRVINSAQGAVAYAIGPEIHKLTIQAKPSVASR